jgi:hypothetical protein
MGRLLVILGLALALQSCITPSIPIPPPDPSQMTFQLQGDVGNTTASFSYPPNVNYEDTVVFVFNRSKGVGIIETANNDGSAITSVGRAPGCDP